MISYVWLLTDWVVLRSTQISGSFFPLSANTWNRKEAPESPTCRLSPGKLSRCCFCFNVVIFILKDARMNVIYFWFRSMVVKTTSILNSIFFFFLFISLLTPLGGPDSLTKSGQSRFYTLCHLVSIIWLRLRFACWQMNALNKYLFKNKCKNV